MRSWHAVCLYLIAVFVGGALAAPWLYHLVQFLASVAPGLEDLARNPFHRFVNRSLLGVALIGLWPLLRAIGVGHWQNLGLDLNPRGFKQLGAGFICGFSLLGAAAALALLAGARSFDFERTGPQLIKHLANASLAAVVVGLLEEILFRGALFGALRREQSWKGALVMSSAIYAVVHFFERPEPPQTVGWASGLTTLGAMLRGFGAVEKFIPGFANLMLAGMLLAFAYQLLRTLHFSIGLHAGWIFWLKSYGFLTRPTTNSHPWFWGTNKLIDGWLAFLLLALFGLAWWLRLKSISNRPAGHDRFFSNFIKPNS